jgi:8-oxo-dGTP pyrophosphatase MutT (NUDIX family)
MQSISREIVGAFIFSQDGMVLLGKNKPGGVYEGLWTIPGGGVEEGEDTITALKREIAEEVGLDIRDADIIALPSKHGESTKTDIDSGLTTIIKMHFHDYRVTLNAQASESELISGDDFSAAHWFNVHELHNLEIADPAKQTLMSLM